MPQRFKHQPKWIAGLTLLGLVLMAAPVVLKNQPAASLAETSNRSAHTPIPVETLTVTTAANYTVARTYTGEMTAVQASELGFERSGQLTKILIPEGSSVQVGTPLAQLDIRNLQTQRMQIEAEKAQAMAQFLELETGARTEAIAAAAAAVQDLEQQVELQSTRIARRETLYAQGAISRENLDEVSFTGGSLQARLNQARSQLAELQNGTRPERLTAQNALIQQLDARLADLDVTISKSTIFAPFSGIVSAHNVDEGTVVGAGQSVVRLVENSIAEAKVGVPSDVVQTLNIGEETSVEIGNETYTATLVSILPEVESQTRTQTIVLTLEPRAALTTSPGQTVRLNLTEQIPTAGMWVPTAALTQGIRGLWNCYAVMPAEVMPAEEGASEEKEAGFVVRSQSVEIIHQEGDRAFVTGTLQPGDVIVASGTHRLVPGQSVEPQEKQVFTQN